MLERVRRNTSVTAAVAITALLYGVVVVGRLASHNWDPSVFVVAGHLFCDQSSAPRGLTISTPLGYDGQFYYRLALDPLTNEQVEYGITIDDPAYRQQRILYPVLARTVALGANSWVPWSMIMVNYLAVCGLAFSAARFAELFAIPAIYGLVIPFFPGVLLALARDLPDPLAISLMVFSLGLLHSRRITFAACMLALAVLARETVVLLAAALFLHSGWRVLRRQSAWTESVRLAIPLMAYAAWQLWIFARWGKLAAAATSGNVLGFPFQGVGISLIQAVHSAHGLHSFVLIEFLFLGAMILLAAIALVQSAVDPGVKLAWLIYLALAASLSSAVWVDWSLMRGCEELIVLGLIIVIGARERRLLPITFAPTLAIWLALAAYTMILQ